MMRRPPRSTLSSSSAASDVYKRQVCQKSKNERKHDGYGDILWSDGICVFDICKKPHNHGRPEWHGHIIVYVDRYCLKQCTADCPDCRDYEYNLVSWYLGF